jgi:hypothetical protein
VLIAFIVFNSNMRSITSLDTYATRILPISIVTEFDLDLDEFSFMHQRPAWAKKSNQKAYYVNYVRDHYMSSYPVMPAILAAPVYAIPVWLGLTDGTIASNGYNQTEIVATFLSKISASLEMALSVTIIYLALKRITTRNAALWIALIYAFATSSWSVSSQGLWQTAMSQPLLALALYWLMKGEDQRRYIIYAGIPVALAVTCRPTAIVFAIVYSLYVLMYYRNIFPRYLVFPVIAGALLITYNLYYFDSITGGYAYVEGGVDEQSAFVAPSLDIAMALLFSPSRGILSLSPVLLFAVAGMGVALYRRKNNILVYTAIAIFLTLLLYSSWRGWNGGFGYSYRFLVDILPGLCMFLALLWNWIKQSPLRKTVFALSVVFSVVVQISGAFFYPCGWLEEATGVDDDGASQFWDWSDPEFARCLANGPVDPDGLRFLRNVINKSN